MSVLEVAVVSVTFWQMTNISCCCDCVAIVIVVRSNRERCGTFPGTIHLVSSAQLDYKRATIHAVYCGYPQYNLYTSICIATVLHAAIGTPWIMSFVEDTMLCSKDSNCELERPRKEVTGRRGVNRTKAQCIWTVIVNNITEKKGELRN